MYNLKEIKSDGRKIIIVTDSDLIGKKFSEGIKQLDLSSDFYNGEDVGEGEVVDVLKGKSVYIIHFTGSKSVSLGKKLGFVSSKCVISIDGVEHAESIF